MPSLARSAAGRRLHRGRSGARRRWGLTALGATLIAGGVWLGSPASAEAAVQGRRGMEIEGARDRRGLYVGGGLGFGGTFFYYDDFIPATRLDFAIGGGVTQRLTLGADLHVTPYLQRSVGVAFGGDIEFTGYVWRGFYLRGGLGAAGVPKRDPTRSFDEVEGMTVGLGGAAGLGYEFFLNATAAMSAGFTYDARFVPGDTFPRQALLVGVRFTWF
ncbi:hypothetical protein [Paraliomyxa miuraensis]|uniref:hypothetical protein n=1 Tax=Paraliomyxa miuraensis TaxID=376150 RepID=UPI00225016D5|nr:hypothetical protein [Paraliomyxa miuraensis]MCX4246995.1 hypothetical protein [Paraliomyxa miuraensis]